jgi:hypothetical protein
VIRRRWHGLMTKMVDIRLGDEIRKSGELMRLAPQNSSICPVDEDFSRLLESFRPPTGVVALRNTVDLAQVPTIGMEEVFRRSHILDLS